VLFIPLGLRPKRKLKLMKTNTIYLEEPNLFCPRTGNKILDNGRVIYESDQLKGVWFHNNLSFPTLREYLWESWNLFEIEQLSIGEDLSFSSIKKGYMAAFNGAFHVDMALIEVRLRDDSEQTTENYKPYCIILMNYAEISYFCPPSIKGMMTDPEISEEEKVTLYISEFFNLLEFEEYDTTSKAEEEAIESINEERQLRKSDKLAYWSICMEKAAEQDEFEKAIVYRDAVELKSQRPKT
jgi:hypothetical protein